MPNESAEFEEKDDFESDLDSEEIEARERATLIKVACALGTLTVLMAWLGWFLYFSATGGARELQQMDAQLSETEASLQIVLSRQLKLLPNLRVMGGGVDSSLNGAARKLKEAGSTPARLEASLEFSQAVNGVSQRIQRSQGEAASSAVSRLLVKLKAGEERIEKSEKRYQSGLDQRAEVAQSFGGKLAIALGWSTAEHVEKSGL